VELRLTDATHSAKLVTGIYAIGTPAPPFEVIDEVFSLLCELSSVALLLCLIWRSGDVKSWIWPRTANFLTEVLWSLLLFGVLLLTTFVGWIAESLFPLPIWTRNEANSIAASGIGP
jgi:hypothetical protein